MVRLPFLIFKHENYNDFFIAENLPQVEEEEEDIQMQEIITESSNDFLYLNEGDDIIKEEQPLKKSDEREENGSVEVDEMSLELLNGQFVNEDEREEEEEEEEQAQNGAEAYENLVKSLTECDNGENNFSLIDGNMLETIYSREGLFQ